MNERKIIDRKYLCDLAKEVGLTTLDLEALGENHHLSFKHDIISHTEWEPEKRVEPIS